VNVGRELDERSRQVLQAVLFEYTVTAEPVGSRQVARKYALGLSPATIRNTMADLEEMGYLTHPHTSAGRVPTDKEKKVLLGFLAAQTERLAAAPDRLKDLAGTKNDSTPERGAWIALARVLLNLDETTTKE